MKSTSLILPLVAALGLSLVGCNKKSDPAKSKADPDGAAPAAASAASPAGPLLLQLKWPAGNQYSERMDMVMEMTMQLPGTPQPMKQDTTMGQEYFLTAGGARPGGGRELTLTFGDFDLHVTMNGNSVMNLDTRGESIDQQNPIGDSLRKIAGAKFKCLLDASNNVEKVEGAKEFLDKLGGGGQDQSRQVLQSVFNEDYLKQMISFGQGFPTEPVRPGTTWPTKLEVAMGPMGTMAMELNHTFKGWETRQKRRCALIEFTGTLKSKGEGGVGAMGVALKFDDGTTTGKSWFDPELGTVVETAMQSKMNVTMGLPGQAGAPGEAGRGTTMKSQINQTVNVQMTEVKIAGK